MGIQIYVPTKVRLFSTEFGDLLTCMQGCGSGPVSGSGFNDFVDPDPEWESGSRGKKMKKNKYRYFFS
jgi:hypothetical protein